MRGFVAGAVGAIGVRLASQSVARGPQVTARTRRIDNVERLRGLGAER
jgi:putative NADH-flavin reductase